MKRNKWLIALILIASISLISGCGSWEEQTQSPEIDPPQDIQDVTEMAGESSLDALETAGQIQTETMEITGYYLDDHGFVAPLTFRVPQDIGAARATLEHMVEGGPGETHLPEGFRALLPQGSTVSTNILEGGLAVVDFSEHFTSYNPQDERKILEAVTWALTEFDSINAVEIRVNGEPLYEMPRDATPLSEPLSRDMGINLERSYGVDYGQSTPVTLYFQSESPEGHSYLVPVTRMIPRTDDILEATIAELVNGPLHDQLDGVLESNVKVLAVQKLLDENLVSVHFNRNFLNADQQVSEASIQSVILSLTETAGLDQVEIMVEGVSELRGIDEQIVTMPVVKPSHVNRVEL